MPICKVLFNTEVGYTHLLTAGRAENAVESDEAVHYVAGELGVWSIGGRFAFGGTDSLGGLEGTGGPGAAR